jgi:D-aspartate ligase
VKNCTVANICVSEDLTFLRRTVEMPVVLLVFKRMQPLRRLNSATGVTPAVVANINNIMGLSIIRSLGREGVPVWGVYGSATHREPYAEVAPRSRYLVRRQVFDDGDYEKGLIECLLRLGEEAESPPVLFPVSDLDMILISSHREALQRRYRLLMPPHALLDALLNKDRFQRLAEERALPVPVTFRAESGAEVAAIAGRVRYPCLVKPPWRDAAWLLRRGNTKVLRCESPDELQAAGEEVLQACGRLAVQELVAGPESNIVCSFAYLNERSEPLAMFVCRKLRQFPPYFGNTALAEGVQDEAAAELTAGICRTLGLVGYASVEFKRDLKDGLYKILEITPSRINRQAGIADASGVSIPSCWYRHLTGQAPPAAKATPGLRWVSEVNDLRAARWYWGSGEWSFVNWLKSYRGIARWELFARDDLKPFFALGLSAARSRFLRR